MQVSYWSVLFGIARFDEVAGSGEPVPDAAGTAVALGIALAPLALGVAAFGTRNDRPTRSTAVGTALFLVVGLSGSLLSAPAGIAAGFAAGAAATVRVGPRHSMTARRWAVVIAFVYLAVLTFVLGPLALITGAVIPFATIGLADMRSEERAQDDAAAPGRGAGERR